MLALAVVLPGRIATAAEASASAATETLEQRDARMRWWREARFGLFIHWGLYSLPAGKWDGKEIVGTRGLLNGAEWIMNYAKIPVAEYGRLAAQFNPTQFDAEAWVSLAKTAGMRYIVITSKHHDGFAMYRSSASPFNLYDATPFKRDPLAELAAACRKHGLKLGFYYSQAQDWHHAGGAAENGHWDPSQDGSMNDYIEKIAVPQVRELLSNYGDVAVLWWDTPHDMTPARAEKFLPLLKLQPQMITNNRLGRGFPGDTRTPEQRIPPDGVPGQDWETCMTMNNTWGYRASDENWKPAEQLIRNLIDIASKGGNYLLNVGPTSEGVIPEPSVERLKAIGRWMAVNGEAIYGTTASPFKERFAWGRCTKKVSADGTTLYLHVFEWPADRRIVLRGLKNEVASAVLLANATAVDAATNTEGVIVTLPAEAPGGVSSTIVLKLKGALQMP